MIVRIPWPHKLLWPNGSMGTPKSRAGRAKMAKHDASYAAIEARQKYGLPTFDGEIPIKLLVYAKPKGPLPDKDNCIAAVKHSLDAIAAQIGVNDRRFAAPLVEFVKPRIGVIEIVIGPQPVDENAQRGCLADSGDSAMKKDGPSGALTPPALDPSANMRSAG